MQLVPVPEELLGFCQGSIHCKGRLRAPPTPLAPEAQPAGIGVSQGGECGGQKSETSAALQCSPHRPMGKVSSAWNLKVAPVGGMGGIQCK